MFSGIIEAKTAVRSGHMHGACRRVSIRKPSGWKLAIGESVNVDGICSTVISTSAVSFEVEYMPQTLSKTTAGDFARGRVVNLERSLVWGARVHGHFVAGHVDTRGKVRRVTEKGRSRSVLLSLPDSLARYAPARGSIAVNGVSLTVARTQPGAVEVALIPHTLKVTNLGSLERGDSLNVECDLAARYRFPSRGARVKRHATKRIHQKAPSRRRVKAPGGHRGLSIQ